jgi:hypothetical protein
MSTRKSSRRSVDVVRFSPFHLSLCLTHACSSFFFFFGGYWVWLFFFFHVGENEPLVPAHTKLLLTTSSTRVRAFGEGEGSQLNTSAYERYFDKPEVIRAYREQQLIQTPEFTLLSEHEAVGGRFRPRGLDDVRAELSSVFSFFLNGYSGFNLTYYDATGRYRHI